MSSNDSTLLAVAFCTLFGFISGLGWTKQTIPARIVSVVLMVIAVWAVNEAIRYLAGI